MRAGETPAVDGWTIQGKYTKVLRVQMKCRPSISPPNTILSIKTGLLALYRLPETRLAVQRKRNTTAGHIHQICSIDCHRNADDI